MGTGPMYCPFGGGLCLHAAIDRCGMDLSNLIDCKVFWEREHASEQFDEGPPKSPPEMPILSTEAKSTFQPLLTGYCVRWTEKVGKKEANSCVGCTVGCLGKGKQEPESNIMCDKCGKPGADTRKDTFWFHKECLK